MDNQKAIEKLQSIANQPEDSLKRFFAREILTYDSPQEFFSLVNDYGIETFYHYDYLEEHEIQQILTNYSKEIQQMDLDSSDKPVSDMDRS